MMAFRTIVGIPVLAKYPAASTRPLVGVGVIGTARLLTDPIGVFALTLEGLVIGSAIQIQASDDTPLFNGTAGASTQLINLQAYAPGSPLNNLRIKVRKGSSASYFQPWETQTLAAPGSQTIFVSQIPDE